MQLFSVGADGFLDEDRANASCQTGDWWFGWEVGPESGVQEVASSGDQPGR